MPQPHRRRFPLERWTIRVAPALGMAAIAASTLLMTESEPRWAQVFAGPTDHAGKVAWRMEVKHGTLERQLPTAARVNFVVSFADKSRIERAVTLDDEGLAWVTFDRPATGLHEPVQVTVREGSQVLANGSVFVPERQWEGAKRLEGGWCSGHREGEREIRLGVVEGVVLHSVPAELVVTLAAAGQPLPNERFSVSADGAEIIGPRSAKASTNRVNLVTDAHGVGHFSLRSTDLAATVRVTSGSPRESSFAGALPIRAGGLYVARDANTLVITSPIGQGNRHHRDAPRGQDCRGARTHPSQRDRCSQASLLDADLYADTSTDIACPLWMIDSGHEHHGLQIERACDRITKTEAE